MSDVYTVWAGPHLQSKHRVLSAALKKAQAASRRNPRIVSVYAGEKRDVDVMAAWFDGGKRLRMDDREAP